VKVGARVARARDIQAARYAALGPTGVFTNAQVGGPLLEDFARADKSGMKLLKDAADTMNCRRVAIACCASRALADDLRRAARR
jgi:predicted ATPase with chaperone activity